MTSNRSNGSDAMRGREKRGAFPFTTIIVTNPDEASARSAQTLLDSTLKRYLNRRDANDAGNGTQREIKIISTCDPFGARCGSFGGTLAALELIRVNDNDKITTSDDDNIETVLCLHAGGDSSRCPLSMILGKAWTNLPSSDYRNPITWLISQLEDLFYRARIPKGSLLVTATDCLISLGEPTEMQLREEIHDTIDQVTSTDGNHTPLTDTDNIDPYLVLGVAVPAPLTTAKNHGVFIMPESTIPNCNTDSSLSSDIIQIESPVEVWQKPSVDKLMTNAMGSASTPNHGLPPTCFDVPHRSGKQAWIDIGIVIFFPKAFETIMELSRGLFALCTRKGLTEAYHSRSNGDIAAATESKVTVLSLESFARQNALKVDLYTDILHNLSFGEKGMLANDNRSSSSNGSMNDIQSSIRRILSEMSLRVLVIPEGSFLHLGTTQEMVEFVTTTPTNSSNKSVDRDTMISNGSTITATNARKIHPIMDQYVTSRLAKALRLNSRFETFPVSVDDENDTAAFQDRSSTALCSTFPKDTLKIDLGSYSFVEYSDLQSYDDISIGDHCMLSGWRRHTRELHSGAPREISLCIPDLLSVQLLPMVSKRQSGEMDMSDHEHAEEEWVMMVLGITDSIKTPIQNSELYGVPFVDFCYRMGISMNQLGFQNDLTDKDCLWTAKIHPIVGTSRVGCDEPSISFSALFGWVEKLRAGDPNLANDKSLLNWISSEKVSLKQIRAISDASKEWTYRTALERKIWGLKSAGHIGIIVNLLKERCQNVPCDLRWMMELDGCDESVAALKALVNALEKLALEEFAKENYDISGRALMLASASIAEFSEGTKADNTNCDENSLNDALMICMNLIKKLKESSSQSQPPSDKMLLVKQIAKIRMSTIVPETRNGMSVCSKVMESLALCMVELIITAGFGRYLDPMYPSKFQFKRTGATIRDKFLLSVAPVRVDLAGGWSDTPPITYEYGGSVTGMAVLIDDYFPLSCRCRLISGGTGILLKTELRGIANGSLLSSMTEEITNISQLANFRNPRANCALLKAALVCLGMVTEEQISHSSDIQNLTNEFCSSVENVRMEIITTSLLGMGTGMGTSSILGACVLQSLAECVGIGKLNEECLIHAVLMLEQLLSSGGGWQDQAHGVVPGIKTVVSAPTIPLQIKIEPVGLSPANTSSFEARLLFAFTGKTRLAKNILQQVLRRWARRTSEIVETVESLKKSSSAVRDAFLNGSWDSVGEHMHQGYKLKCAMAGEDSGAEPESVKLFIDELISRGQITGAMLCGAGGGGFLLLMLSPGVDSNSMKVVFQKSILPLSEDFKDYSFHSCRVSHTGLTSSILDGKSVDTDDYELSWQSSV